MSQILKAWEEPNPACPNSIPEHLRAMTMPDLAGDFHALPEHEGDETL